MMPARKPVWDLVDRLPAVRGRYVENAPLAPYTWFRVGGPAEVLFRPADHDDLAAFLAGRPDDVPVTVLGSGSNALVRDGGIPGVVVRLDRPFADIEIMGERVRAGAMALGIKVALTACDAGVAGLEFLSGVPGTIGGALRMNAGAYGREIADVLVEAEALDPQGELHRIDAAGMGFAYRHSDIDEGWIFTGAILQGERDDPLAIHARITRLSETRESTQPVRLRTGGSTFKNPSGAKAWELIDRAGCRGLRRGKAMVSDLHCNFLVNTGGATAADLEELGEEVRRRVKEAAGVTLEWEVRRLGEAAP